MWTRGLWREPVKEPLVDSLYNTHEDSPADSLPSHKHGSGERTVAGAREAGTSCAAQRCGGGWTHRNVSDWDERMEGGREPLRVLPATLL